MLRDFQIQLKNDIYTAWRAGAKHVMAVAPTGSGKTVVMASVVQDFNAPTCVIAHRQELVAQISLALNREGVPHGLIAPEGVRAAVIAAQIETHGRSHFNRTAPVRVAGVDTLINHDQTDRWFSLVQLVSIDEGHHIVKTNKWDRALDMFPNARELSFTAHALRADGQGLGRSADGRVDKLVLGPNARNLINRGYLTDYRIVCPQSDVDMEGVEIGPSGELNMRQTAERIHASKSIVGDTVKNYTHYAEGELGITFAVDVQSAHEICDRFIAARIPAAVITAKTPIAERAMLMRKFRMRQILQLVNVDVLGEGTDVPACVVVIMARPTASFQLCAQQFGRMLRVMVSDDLNARWHELTDAQRLAHIAASSKPKGICIDQVGNVATVDAKGRHGLPDRPRVYSLERRERRSKQAADAIPLRVCGECLQPYEAVLSACPHCGAPRPLPRARSSPEAVEGDLYELDPEVLRQLRGEIDRIDIAPRIPQYVSAPVAGAIKKHHWDRQQAQGTLRDAIATWAGWQTHLGRDDREAQRRFFHAFRVDVMSAQVLSTKDAAELETLIRTQLEVNNVVKVF